MKYLIIIATLLLIQNISYAKKNATTEIDYTYKKREVFDFGELSIKGSVITPGDLSIKGQKRKQFRTEFHIRDNFDLEIEQDLLQSGN
jgi:hypothetical protein